MTYTEMQKSVPTKWLKSWLLLVLCSASFTMRANQADEIVISNVGVATYYADYGFVLPTGLTASIVRQAGEGQLVLFPLYAERDTIPACTAVIITGAEGTYPIEPLRGLLATPPFDNQLRGSETETKTWGGNAYYKLAGTDASTVMFYHGAEGGGAFTSAPNKAWLPVKLKDGEQSLPELHLSVADAITKTDYVDANISMTKGDEMLIASTDVHIKGHGNSTWGRLKKPYKIKFDEKTSMLNFPKGKPWILLANWYDRTMLRNWLAFKMGANSKLDWTPGDDFFVLDYNGQGKGVYELAESVNINKSRVNLPKNGVILETNSQGRITEDDWWFKTPRDLILCVKDSDYDMDEEHLASIEEQIVAAESVLYGKDYLDAETGWAQYFDMESFAEWYAIQEISKNKDARMSFSCFMTVVPGEKIKMGPLWDFDLAFGNTPTETHAANNPEGLYIASAVWIKRMMTDPQFHAMARERMEQMNEQMPTLLDGLNAQAVRLCDAWMTDASVWNLEENADNDEALRNAYAAHIKKMKQWVINRLDWLMKNL